MPDLESIVQATLKKHLNQDELDDLKEKNNNQQRQIQNLKDENDSLRKYEAYFEKHQAKKYRNAGVSANIMKDK